MSTPSEVVTPALLRDWSLPEVSGSKHGRGRVLVVGGAAKTPGAAILAGLAALRVGAGHLQLAVASSTAVPMAVAIPEAGVIGLAETAGGSVRGDSASDLEGALAAVDVVLVGSGLDDADETAALLRGLAPLVAKEASVVLDAYALGVLVDLDDVRSAFGGRYVLTPNTEEAARLLGDEPDDMSAGVVEIARRYEAVVSCQGLVADPDGRRWEVRAGHVGLATSGSGDVLAGCVTGLLARGASPAQAACWATHLHASAGDRLAGRVGPLGFLGRELLDELPPLLVELTS
jgi:ADP-dependent NAD(P)H-hydrate dehydratase